MMKRFAPIAAIIVAATFSASANAEEQQICSQVHIEAMKGGVSTDKRGLVVCGLTPQVSSSTTDQSHWLDIEPMKFSQRDPVTGTSVDFEIKDVNPVTTGFDVTVLPSEHTTEKLRAKLILNHRTFNFANHDENGGGISRVVSISTQTRSFASGEVVEWAGDTDLTYRVSVQPLKREEVKPKAGA